MINVLHLLVPPYTPLHIIIMLGSGFVWGILTGTAYKKIKEEMTIV